MGTSRWLPYLALFSRTNVAESLPSIERPAHWSPLIRQNTVLVRGGVVGMGFVTPFMTKLSFSVKVISDRKVLAVEADVGSPKWNKVPAVAVSNAAASSAVLALARPARPGIQRRAAAVWHRAAGVIRWDDRPRIREVVGCHRFSSVLWLVSDLRGAHWLCIEKPMH